jgi:PAS domain S-box-containing protein
VIIFVTRNQVTKLKYKILFENTFDAVLLTKPDGTILAANPAALKMFGMTFAELKKAGRSGLVTTDKRLDAALNDREKTGNARVELRLKRKDGSTFEGDVTSNLFTDADGETKTSMIIRDISECKKDHQRLSLVNEKMRVTGTLVRHDVRNKLSIIKSNAYLIKKKFGDQPGLLTFIKNIDDAVEASSKLFDFSSNYEKIGSEKPSELDVEECFKQAVNLLPAHNDVTIVCKCAELKVTADSLLRQLFYNLLDNSFKHGKKVTEIHLFTEKMGNSIKLIYEDNGVGIPKENKVKIFTEGFTTGNGSGLGLMLVRRIAQAYGWDFTEEGLEGNGAKFVISIPCYDVQM